MIHQVEIIPVFPLHWLTPVPQGTQAALNPPKENESELQVRHGDEGDDIPDPTELVKRELQNDVGQLNLSAERESNANQFATEGMTADTPLCAILKMRTIDAEDLNNIVFLLMRIS